jgi:hypothetical protein
LPPRRRAQGHEFVWWWWWPPPRALVAAARVILVRFPGGDRRRGHRSALGTRHSAALKKSAMVRPRGFKTGWVVRDRPDPETEIPDSLFDQLWIANAEFEIRVKEHRVDRQPAGSLCSSNRPCRCLQLFTGPVLPLDFVNSTVDSRVPSHIVLLLLLASAHRSSSSFFRTAAGHRNSVHGRRTMDIFVWTRDRYSHRESLLV